jgi:hypothetical protein
LDTIAASDFVVGDITSLNFNVVYEIGFAIGKTKRVIVIKNSALRADDDLIRELGIFDTLGYQSYQSSQDIVSVVLKVKDTRPLTLNAENVNKGAPVFVLQPRDRTDFENRIISRVKKARLRFRSFDPVESGRLSAPDAISNVAMSHGVVVPLLPTARQESKVHNLRAAFVAGLGEGMGKKVLLLQQGNDPIPIDYSDLAYRVNSMDQVDGIIGDFAPDITACLQEASAAKAPSSASYLSSLNLGASAAENEISSLGDYYLETDEFQRALSGEAQVIAGRKGSGKTALFFQLRDRMRAKKNYVVLDLMPESSQLLKFKDVVLKFLEQGTKEHTITLFWEYLLLLETCHKMLEMDKDLHLRNHDLFQPYRDLAGEYKGDTLVAEGDFAERITRLTQQVAGNFREAIRSGESKLRLSTAEITDLLYKRKESDFRQRVFDYLKFKKGLWILFDNIDKGWPPHGIGPDDLVILKCLLDAVAKTQRFLANKEIECHGTVFLRNDIYELLLEETTDRGKLTRIAIDWTDAALLRELLRKRFITGGTNPSVGFDQIWTRVCVSHIKGEETSQYLIDRCLMRPRCLIDLLRFCRSHAVNLGHAKIEVEDVTHGEESYSSDLVTNIGFEIRDVFPHATDFLYEFVGMPPKLPAAKLEDLMAKVQLPLHSRKEFVDLLLWYGVLGLLRSDGEATYIYSVRYDRRRLDALIRAVPGEHLVYHLNPAFWAGLDIRP